MQKASETLDKKTKEILQNPPKHDKNGRERDTGIINYREAFDMVCQDNPELVKEYIIELDGGA